MRLATHITTILLLAMVTTLRAAESTFAGASSSVEIDLRSAQKELTELNRKIAEEKLPLSRKVTELEFSTATKRGELDTELAQARDATESISGFEAELEIADQEVEFVTSSLAEFGHFLETKIHISELRQYEDAIEQAESVVEDVNLSPRERLEKQLALLDRAANRVGELMGGQTFEGEALSDDGELEQGRFALAGPIAVFAGNGNAGIAQLEVNTLDPVLIPINGGDTNQLGELVQNGKGLFPVDASGGRALRIQERQETLQEHLIKGGVVMIPILALAVMAAMLGIVKWAQVGFLRAPLPQDVELILKQLAADQKAKALDHARSLKGPAGNLLETAIENADQKKELLEEMLYERVLHIRPRLERWLPFIGLTAAVAPLLGLLGTVTGMINTFKLITLFGTGDAKTLSSGISEALVTTECGLIVAVAALLIHAFLTRRIRGFITSLEQAAVGFVNGLALKRDDE
ncbi:MAG: MotA/TolQ/ExbB proton channel family protein [Limisphaerales bacterium]